MIKAHAQSRLRTLIVSLLLFNCIALMGCSAVAYRHDVNQGNVLDQHDLAYVKVGTTREQVQQYLGDPVLRDVFDDDMWSYVYTSQHGHGDMKTKTLHLYFKNNHVSRIERR